MTRKKRDLVKYLVLDDNLGILMGVYKPNFMTDPIAIWSTINPLSDQAVLFDTEDEAAAIIDRLLAGEASPKGLVPTEKSIYTLSIPKAPLGANSISAGGLNKAFPTDLPILAHTSFWMGTLVSRVLLSDTVIEA